MPEFGQAIAELLVLYKGHAKVKLDLRHEYARTHVGSLPWHRECVRARRVPA